MYVIPVLNCKDVKCVEARVRAAEKFLEPWHFLHIDIADGTLSPYATWNDPESWKKLHPSFNIEVHLMVERPEDHVGSWISAGARRCLVHAEALTMESAKELVDICEPDGIELMLSSNPDTPTDALEPYLDMFSAFQVLAVHPGPAGQELLPAALEKIRFLREEVPDATIEVDGGITPDTARLVKAAGADTIVSGTYIFGSPDPGKAYEKLNNI